MEKETIYAPWKALGSIEWQTIEQTNYYIVFGHGWQQGCCKKAIMGWCELWSQRSNSVSDPKFEGGPQTDAACNWPLVCLFILSTFLSFSLSFSLFGFSFGAPSLKMPTSFLLLCWDVLTRHLSCSHSPMFDLIAFPVPWNALSSQGWEKYMKSLPNILYPNGFSFPCSL